MDSYAGKLFVTVHRLKGVKCKTPFVSISVGRQTFRTFTSENADGNWNQYFEFDCSCHSRLFFALTLSVYEPVFWGASTTFLGKAKISIKQLCDYTNPTQIVSILGPDYQSTLNYESSRNAFLPPVQGEILLTVQFVGEQRLKQSVNIPSKVNSPNPISQENENENIPENKMSKEIKKEELRQDIEGTHEKIQSVKDEAELNEQQQQHQNSEEHINDLQEKEKEEEEKEKIESGEPKEGEQKEVDVEQQSLKDGYEEVDMAKYMNEMEKSEDEIALLDAKPQVKKEDGNVLKTMKGVVEEEADEIALGKAIREERKVAWMKFSEMLMAWGENLPLHETILGFKLLEGYYEEQIKKREPKPNCATTELISDAIYYFQYALAVFGLNGLVYCKKIKKTDYFQHSDYTAVFSFLGIPKEHYIRVRLHSIQPFRPSHLVVYDESRQEIIISVRGTMSLNDALIDGVCEYAQYEEGYVHKGMHLATNWLLGSIIRPITIFCEKHKVKRIVSVGHSLGAAVATLLTITLKHFKDTLPESSPLKNVDVFAHSYATPPTISEPYCDQFDDMIFNYVNNNDIVPQLSFGSLMDCKSMILIALDQHNSTDQRLKQITRASTMVPSFIKKTLGVNPDDPFTLPTLSPEQKKLHPKLCVAGRIFHMIPYKVLKNKGKSEVVYTMEEKNREEFTEIHVTSDMLLDHLPDLYEDALNNLGESLIPVVEHTLEKEK